MRALMRRMGPWRKRLDARYGTWRGMLRLWLAELEFRARRLDPFASPDLRRVERIVWVCLGNVCRSPYAELIARGLDIPGSSCGLSTTTGAPACADALAAAARTGRDLGGHRATDWTDMEARCGDLFVVMEVRQARALVQRVAGTGAQVTLLGLWASPRRLHIHDPMTLCADYFDTCYRVIASGVDGLGRAWRAARGSSPTG